MQEIDVETAESDTQPLLDKTPSTRARSRSRSQVLKGILPNTQTVVPVPQTERKKTKRNKNAKQSKRKNLEFQRRQQPVSSVAPRQPVSPVAPQSRAAGRHEKQKEEEKVPEKKQDLKIAQGDIYITQFFQVEEDMITFEDTVWAKMPKSVQNNKNFYKVRKHFEMLALKDFCEAYGFHEALVQRSPVMFQDTKPESEMELSYNNFCLVDTL